MSRNIYILFIIFCTFTSVLYAQNDEHILNEKGQIISNLLDSSISYRDSVKNISVEICEKAIQVAEKEKSDSLLALALKTQGINYYYLGQFDSSMVYYDRAVLKFKQLGNTIQVGKTIGNIGIIYKKRGEYSKALEYYLKEQKLFLEINYTVGLIPLYPNLGNISVSMNNLQRAEEYYQLGLKLAEDVSNLRVQVNCLNNLGVIYEKQNKFEEALKVYKKSLSIVLNTGNIRMESRLYLNLGIIYRRTNAFDKAAIYLNKSFDIRKLRGDTEELLKIYNEMFELAFAKEEYDKARQFAATMYELAKMSGSGDWLGDSQNAYFRLYKKTGNYKLALESYEKLTAIGDSINSALNDEMYNDLMVKYDMDQTKQKMELMTQKTKIKDLELDKKNAWLIAMIVFMILGVIGIVVAFRMNKLRAEYKVMSLDQKVLLSQMNPHFIFNALTSVQSLVLDNETDKAFSYLSKLSGLVRGVLENSTHEYISMREELDILSAYIDLQNLRFENTITYRFDIDAEIDLDEVYIPPMLAQPIIENALVHGELRNNPDATIKICLFKNEENNSIDFTVEDNGIGILNSKKRKGNHKSMATDILKDRVKIYNYNSKKNISIKVIDLKTLNKELHGTRVSFSVPNQA